MNKGKRLGIMMIGAIVIIPIGKVPGDLLIWVKAALAESLGCEVRIGKPRALSEDWYDGSRRQYRGTEILRALAGVPRGEGDRVLGVADVDCYAGGLNFIFGQATLRSGEAFVALPRLRQSFYGLPEDPGLFRRRALKESLHELGHTWGLEHCPDPRCVMHFSNSLADTDAKSAAFCAECEKRLRSLRKGRR